MSEPGPSGRAHRTGGGVARVPIVIGIVALLAVGGLADRQAGATKSTSGSAVHAVSAAAPAAALSSSWFCAGATASPSGPAAGQLIIANAGDRTVKAVISLVPSTGAGPAPLTVMVPPKSRQAVPEQLPSVAPWVGAIVNLDGGMATVEQQITGSLGIAATPCATSGSNQWYFTSGETLVNATLDLNLLNPYPTDAIVDLSFTTEQGAEEPGDFQALTVPAGGMLTVDVGSHLRRRQHIATRVTSRNGRVVAWQTQVVSPPAPGTPLIGAAGSPATGSAAAGSAAVVGDPADPVAGVTVSLGSPAAATSWSWPDGVAGNGVDEQYVIYNPGPGTAQLELALNLEQGSAEPFSLTVGPDAVATVVSSAEARVPAGVAHAAVLRSVNGVPVVAARAVTAAPPSPALGRGILAGGLQPARRWLVGAGGTNPQLTMWLVLLNPGPAPVTATVHILGAANLAFEPVTVPPGGRQAIRVNDQVPALDAALVVTGTGPLFVERDLYGKERGVSLSLGAPLPDS
ncbi:MAG: DUF5719 family protein [Actinomycetota bacterium]|nr:DUF5719 family protein [Actinomycetota bacterium]